jgi:HEAT repeat protein
MCRYTSSQDIDLRHQSLTALNSYGGAVEGRDEIYIQLLSSKDGIMRRGSVEGIIQRFQTLGMIPFLYAALERIIRSDTNWQSRLHAVEVLEWVQDSDVLLLEAAQRDENTTIRARAISALGTKRSTKYRKEIYRIAKQDLDTAVRKEAEKSLKRIGGKVEEVVLAVMPFDITPEFKDLEEGFRSYLSGRLGGTELATVVERGQVQSVVNELIYQDNFINDGTAVEIGKALRAEQVVTGTIQIMHGQVVLTIKRIDVRTQKILSSSEGSGSFVDFEQIQRVAASKFIEEF